VGHITPEAFSGGALAIARDGDSITIDADKRTLNLNLPAKEIKDRFKAWKAPRPKYNKGVLAKYAKLVSSAHLGAVTDLELF
jgi:dihydroxy-acid dehydratase